MDRKELLKELADVFDTEQAARDLLEDIGIPRRRLPFAHDNPEQFWRNAVRELDRGLIPDATLEFLVNAAHELYPGNPTFQTFRAFASIPAGDQGPPTPYRSTAPPADPLFVHRAELDAVRDLLIDAIDATVGITTALRGAGGFGKTALAQKLCEDPDIRAAYPDGILWAQMRDDMRDADRLAVVKDLLRHLRPDEAPTYETLPIASARLREVLAGQRVLVVVDDVWHAADIEPFRGFGAVLITTRIGDTLPRGCKRVDVDALRASEAVAVLSADLELNDIAAFEALAKRLGEWPLLLRLVNRQLHELMGKGLDEALNVVETLLDKYGLTAFDLV